MKLLSDILGAGPLAIACSCFAIAGGALYSLELAPVADVHHVEHHGVSDLEIETRFR